ncbi:uncharacterized protein [Apostichopus japonicus]|uniref:uncharacterized protein isoform X3 n=1 Tax=Stichopus japonicus TaxID=307972 RepID=UPI003AB1AEBD
MGKKTPKDTSQSDIHKDTEAAWKYRIFFEYDDDKASDNMVRRERRKETGISSPDVRKKSQKIKRKYYLQETSPSDNSDSQYGESQCKIHCRCRLEEDEDHYQGVQYHHSLARERKRKTRLRRQRRRERIQQNSKQSENADRSDFRRHMKKVQEITSKAKVDQPKTDVSQANAVTVITQNRLTRKLGIYNQGKKSNKVSRDSIIIPETVQAQTEEGLKRILDIRPAEKSETISPWSCDKDDKKKSSTSSCYDNPAVTYTTLNNWVLHKTPPQSSKLIQSDGTISSKSCDQTDGSSSSKISGIKEFPKSPPLKEFCTEFAESLDLEKVFPGHEDYVTKIYKDLRKLVSLTSPASSATADCTPSRANGTVSTKLKTPVRRRLEDDFKKAGCARLNYLKSCMENNVSILEIVAQDTEQANRDRSRNNHNDSPVKNDREIKRTDIQKGERAQNSSHKASKDLQEHLPGLSSLGKFRKSCGLSYHRYKGTSHTGNGGSANDTISHSANSTVKTGRNGKLHSRHGDVTCNRGDHSRCCTEKEPSHHGDRTFKRDMNCERAEVSSNVHHSPEVSNTQCSCDKLNPRHCCQVVESRNGTQGRDSSNMCCIHKERQMDVIASTCGEIGSGATHCDSVTGESHIRSSNAVASKCGDCRSNLPHGHTDTDKSRLGHKDVETSSHNDYRIEPAKSSHSLDQIDLSRKDVSRGHPPQCETSHRHNMLDQSGMTQNNVIVSNHRDHQSNASNPQHLAQEVDVQVNNVIASTDQEFRLEPKRELNYRQQESSSRNNMEIFDTGKHQSDLSNYHADNDQRKARYDHCLESTQHRYQDHRSSHRPTHNHSASEFPESRLSESCERPRVGGNSHDFNSRYEGVGASGDGRRRGGDPSDTRGSGGVIDLSRYNSEEVLINTRMQHESTTRNRCTKGRRILLNEKLVRFNDAYDRRLRHQQMALESEQGVQHRRGGQQTISRSSRDGARTEGAGYSVPRTAEQRPTDRTSSHKSRAVTAVIVDEKEPTAREESSGSRRKLEENVRQTGPKELTSETTKDELMDAMMDGLQFIRKADEINKLWAQCDEKKNNQPNTRSVSQENQTKQDQPGERSEKRFEKDGTREAYGYQDRREQVNRDQERRHQAMRDQTVGDGRVQHKMDQERRDQATRDQAMRDGRVQHKMDQERRDQATRDQAMRDGRVQDKMDQERRDQALRDQAMRDGRIQDKTDQERRDQALRDQAMRDGRVQDKMDQERRDQATRDQAMRDGRVQDKMDQERRDQALRDQAMRDQAIDGRVQDRDQNRRNQAMVDQAMRDCRVPIWVKKDKRDQSLRDQAMRDGRIQDRIDHNRRDQALRDQAMRDGRVQDKMDQERRDQALRDQAMRDGRVQDKMDQERRDQALRDQAMRDGRVQDRIDHNRRDQSLRDQAMRDGRIQDKTDQERRDQALRDQAMRDGRVQDKIDQERRDQSLRDQAMRDGRVQDKMDQERRDQALRDQAMRDGRVQDKIDQERRDQATRDQAMRDGRVQDRIDHNRRDLALRDQAMRDGRVQDKTDQERRDQALRDQAMRDGRVQDKMDQERRDQATRDQAMRDGRVQDRIDHNRRDLALRDQAMRDGRVQDKTDQERRDQALRDQAMRDGRVQDKMDQERRDQALRDQAMRDQAIDGRVQERDQNRRNQAMVDQAMRDCRVPDRIDHNIIIAQERKDEFQQRRDQAVKDQSLMDKSRQIQDGRNQEVNDQTVRYIDWRDPAIWDQERTDQNRQWEDRRGGERRDTTTRDQHGRAQEQRTPERRNQAALWDQGRQDQAIWDQGRQDQAIWDQGRQDQAIWDQGRMDQDMPNRERREERIDDSRIGSGRRNEDRGDDQQRQRDYIRSERQVTQSKSSPQLEPGAYDEGSNQPQHGGHGGRSGHEDKGRGRTERHEGRRDNPRQKRWLVVGKQGGGDQTNPRTTSTAQQSQSSPGLQFPYPRIFWRKGKHPRWRTKTDSDSDSESEEEDFIPSWYMDLALQPPIPSYAKTPKLYPQKMF